MFHFASKVVTFRLNFTFCVNCPLRQLSIASFCGVTHLIKRWRNQILNVRRVLVLGKGVVQMEHLMKTYEMNRIRSGLWKSDVFVKDKENVDAALRILQDEVRQEYT